MTVSLPTRKPTFHALSAAVPLGHKQVFVRGYYAGTVTTVTRINRDHWSVTVREVRGAFRSPSVGMSATVWLDTNGQYVSDYWDDSQRIEIDRSDTLAAAMGMAIWSAGYRGHVAGRW